LETKRGCLYVCPTPIGNLEDITLRALQVLRQADLVAAEDTRRTRKLFSHYGISTPLVSYREHNRRKQGEYVLAELLQGKEVALVSDAGTPGIADPGFDLVGMALEAGLPVEVLPGPAALVTALLASGYPPVPFSFWGFLPARGKQRKEALARIGGLQETLILYEAPHRLVRTLEDLKEQGFLEAALCRELTKKFAEVRRGTLEEHLEHYASRPARGEFVLVLKPRVQEVPAGSIPPEEEVASLMAQGLDKKDAILQVSRRRGLPKREVYRRCHGLKAEKNSTA
jgi:16S rRNA (cytidine1402-2'-O)-methyltransferase